jgi:hypothetical protein
MQDCTISDGATQTRAIVASEARVATGCTPAGRNNDKFHAYQLWLHHAGVRSVVVPFAEALGERVRDNAVRMRRDFRQLVSAIKTVAFLTQKHRQRDGDGAIIATLNDYAKARELLVDTFDSTAADSITQAVRDTVEAVKDSETVTSSDLVARLGLSKSTVSYRVNAACEGGWLKNSEHRKGYPSQLTRGTPMPDKVSGLPTVEELAGCSNEKPFEQSSKGHSNSPQLTGGVGPTDEPFECSTVFRGVGKGAGDDDHQTSHKEDI